MKACVVILQIIACAFLTGRLYAQSVENDVRLYFEGVRAGAESAMPKFDDTHGLDVVRPYLSDTMETVRVKARELLFALASFSIKPAIRSGAIEQLLAATGRNDLATTGVVVSMLKTFEKYDFTDSAKMHVRRLLKDEGPYLAEWMKIAGFLELKDLDHHIRPYTQPGNQQSLRWSALLSLARMGDGRASTEVLARAKKLGVNDDVVYKLFPDLLFTRDPSVINYMVDVLHQDADHCLSADVERASAIPCGYRIMELLAPVVEGFPFSPDESGDLNADDYALALRIVREWFLMHEKYSIEKERY